MNVLSLFDGISCGQVALQRAGFTPKHYFASEIDTHAMSVTRKHFPNTLQVGSVTGLHNVPFDQMGIDLLMGGSPCQGFSFAGKQLNFDDPRSKLFFDFVNLKNRLKPKYFLLENVAMKQEFRDVIDDQLGVEGVMINSNEFSAQGRKRYYWTNIPFTTNSLVGQVKKDIITVEDILQDNVDHHYWISKDNAITICENEVEKGKLTRGADANQYYIHGNLVTLNDKHTQISDMRRVFAMPCITPNRLKKRQNGRRFNPPFSKFYTLTTQDRHGILINGGIRKLTPLECERLQTLPDNYTEGLSDAKRYHALGNGWTVDVIAHILKGMDL